MAAVPERSTHGVTVGCEEYEAARIRAVRRYEVLEAPPEPAIRRIADESSVSSLFD